LAKPARLNLVSAKSAKDFEIKFQAKLNKVDGDAGLSMRGNASVPIGKDLGKFYSVYGLPNKLHSGKNQDVLAKIRKDDFNDISIKCVGKHVRVMVNGVTTIDEEFADISNDGRLTFYVSGGGVFGRNIVTLRNIWIKELPAPQAGDIKPETWTPLFNGKDLDGWTSKNSQFGIWKVENGHLIGQGNQARLRTERDTFKDFHLRIEAKHVAGGGNLVIREQADIISKGYTIFIGNKPAGFQSGALTSHFAKGGPIQVQDKELTKTNEWFTLEVIAKGNRLQVFVNGVRTADAEDANKNFVQGFIRLGITGKGGELQVKKIEIKELPPTSAETQKPQALLAEPPAIEETKGGLLIQSGLTPVENLGVLQLYYPRPFAKRPSLVMEPRWSTPNG